MLQWREFDGTNQEIFQKEPSQGIWGRSPPSGVQRPLSGGAKNMKQNVKVGCNFNDVL